MDELVVVRGGGDLGTGVAWTLHRAGFPVIVTETARPLTVRRTVAFSTAVTDGAITVDGVAAVLDAAATTERVAVVVSEGIPDLDPSVVVDARMAKEPQDTSLDDAPLVIGLGPGFTAGVDAHAVIETNRGPGLGRVIWEGSAEGDTGVPAEIGGESARRVLRAPSDGEVAWDAAIGDRVTAGQVLGNVHGLPVSATITGVIRGLIAPGPVSVGLKIGDIDPRDDPELCYHISDKSHAIGEGALEAVMTWIDR